MTRAEAIAYAALVTNRRCVLDAKMVLNSIQVDLKDMPPYTEAMSCMDEIAEALQKKIKEVLARQA